MNLESYSILEKAVTFEEEIKKSRFITQLIPVDTAELAKANVEAVRKEHPQARHHCWGYVLGRADDSMLWGFSDDGEPSGTAGKPILSQLSGSGIGQMLAVVTRYSGGIKLGTGGLVKAYGGGVAQALALASKIEKKIMTQLHLNFSYDMMPLVQNLMNLFDVKQLDAVYDQAITLKVEVESRLKDDFHQAMINQSRACIMISQPEDN